MNFLRHILKVKKFAILLDKGIAIKLLLLTLSFFAALLFWPAATWIGLSIFIGAILLFTLTTKYFSTPLSKQEQAKYKISFPGLEHLQVSLRTWLLLRSALILGILVLASILFGLTAPLLVGIILGCIAISFICRKLGIKVTFTCKPSSEPFKIINHDPNRHNPYYAGSRTWNTDPRRNHYDSF